MPDEKDRLGEKLHQKEKAEENRFFAERDKALIEKLRREKAAEQGRHAAPMRCPKCGEQLVAVEHLGVTVDECPKRHGVWVDDQQIETLAQREHDSWIGRFFYRPKL